MKFFQKKANNSLLDFHDKLNFPRCARMFAREARMRSAENQQIITNARVDFCTTWPRCEFVGMPDNTILILSIDMTVASVWIDLKAHFSSMKMLVGC